jgi:adenine-specific DNA-methyltransferase
MPFVDWVNKNQAKESTHRVPVHLLQQEAVYGDTTGPYSDNLLIQGDNLLALKALMPVYAGRIKCIFIDPPYNTQSAFEHYDDKLEHSQWLSMMYPRLVLLRELLGEDGSIWITADDNETHYLKVLCDEVFGRANFVRHITWQKKYSVSNNFRGIASITDHVLVYRKSPAFANQLLPRTDDAAARYSNPDNDPRGPWKAVDYLNQASIAQRKNLVYDIENPITGEIVTNKVKAWKYERTKHEDHVRENRLWWGLKGENSVPALKLFLSEVRDGMTPHNWWPHSEAGHTDEAKKESIALFGATSAFSTPKPERLLHRVLTLATRPGDIVLDSFLGSGTTSAVAHKMGRRYVGIEMGDHARTHCAPRLEKVIAGEQGGISNSVNWKGGGGFRFCRLGEAAFDVDGRINPDVRFNTLASFIWHFETATPAADTFDKPLLGVHEGNGYYLLYNGILGDRRPDGGNVLTRSVLQMLKEQYPHEGPKVIYGETTRLGDASLAAEGVTFQQIPYDIKVR